MTNPIVFLRQVRDEGQKVVWPTQRETLVTSLMVVVMAVIASIFFLLTDQVISRFVALLLGLHR